MSYNVRYYDNGVEKVKSFDYPKQAFDFLELIVLPNTVMVPDSLVSEKSHIYFLAGGVQGAVAARAAKDLAKRECGRFRNWMKQQTVAK